MHPKQLQELRSAIRQLMFYADQMGIPQSQRAEKIEQKINLQRAPGTTDSEYSAFKAEIRKLIEDMLAGR